MTAAWLDSYGLTAQGRDCRAARRLAAAARADFEFTAQKAARAAITNKPCPKSTTPTPKKRSPSYAPTWNNVAARAAAIDGWTAELWPEDRQLRRDHGSGIFLMRVARSLGAGAEIARALVRAAHQL